MTPEKAKEMIATCFNTHPKSQHFLVESLVKILIQASKEAREELRAERDEAIEVIRKARLGLHEANLERNAPVFAWPLKDCEDFLSRMNQRNEEKK